MRLDQDSKAKQRRPPCSETTGTGTALTPVRAAGAIVLGLCVCGVGLARDEPRPAFPEMQLPRSMRGEQALQAWGDRLPSVAAYHRMTPRKLQDIMQRDKTAWIDRKGRLLFIDEQPELPEPTESMFAPATAEAVAPYALEQTFLLHSRAGSKRVIYLDFNGHVVTGSAWNSKYGMSTINAPGYDLDGDPSTFNATERERIQRMWQRVAEDYLPFNVDVTTEEPPAGVITRSTSSDDTYGTRAVITRDFTASTSSPCGCGGFAYVGVFDHYPNDNYKPAWVFFDRLANGSEKYVAEAISHEVGHNLGLSHDGTSSTSYYTGHGSGATGWAPIMGSGYSKEVVQWSKGEYPGANNREDDIAVIVGNGAPLVTDNYGDTTATAAPLNGVSNGSSVSVDQSGEIERRTDADLFAFTSAAGAIKLNAAPAERGPDLDISVALYDASGSLVASSNPADALSATLDVTVSPGNYYVRIDGIGKGDLSTGYSDFGSLGFYHVTGSYPASSAVAPVAVATASQGSSLQVSFDGHSSQDPDGFVVAYDWNFGDGSAHSTDMNPLHTYGAAGTYTVTLTVTDSQGLKGSTAVTVTVNPDPSALAVRVGNIDMSVTRIGSYYQGIAKVTVLDRGGRAVSGATVSGKWSGLVSTAASAKTSSTGIAQFTTARTRLTGTFTFTVTGISYPGYSYDASQNTETSDSISR